MASKRLLVGAIDFGTTYSGWAFSFLHDYSSDPTKITVKNWQSGGRLVTEKAPTCALIKPDGKTLEAFGYDAENKYQELVDNDEHRDYFYFKRFKMSLNRKLDEGVSRDFTIENDMSQSLSALTVFSLVIEYLTKDMIEVVNSGISGKMSRGDVLWVLTVPAIWTDPAKQFMRQAAEKAGIRKKNLIICLEPEAASIFCKHLPVQKKADAGISSFLPGTKYMILDAGGGTVDITVHQVQRSGGLKEVKSASGGGWGATLVDAAFETFIVDLVTRRVYTKFVQTETEDWLDLWRDFEVKKKSVSPDKDSRFVVKIPHSLKMLCEKANHRSLSEVIDSSKYSGEVTVMSDKMKINASLMRGLFDSSVKTTVAHVKTLLRDPKVKEIKAIVMVGGFSESPMLQLAVKSAFPAIAVIIPPEAATSILKGAVIFGHSPKSITDRVLKYTYGGDRAHPFREGEHPESKREVCDSGVMCVDVFDKHAEIDQTVPVDHACKAQRYRPCNRSQKRIQVNIFASQLKNPRFVDEGCTKIGYISVDIPEHTGDMENGIYVSMKFGGTEIEVTGRDEVTGEETKVTVDFLG